MDNRISSPHIQPLVPFFKGDFEIKTYIVTKDKYINLLKKIFEKDISLIGVQEVLNENLSFIEESRQYYNIGLIIVDYEDLTK